MWVTLAARHFKPAEILSSDAYREAVSGDPTNQSATDEAFARLHEDLDRRLADGQLTVVDATNVQAQARSLLAVAADHGRPAVAVVLALPLDVSWRGTPAGSAGASRQAPFDARIGTCGRRCSSSAERATRRWRCSRIRARWRRSGSRHKETSRRNGTRPFDAISEVVTGTLMQSQTWIVLPSGREES